jgi:hypothetical protein
MRDLAYAPQTFSPKAPWRTPLQYQDLTVCSDGGHSPNLIGSIQTRKYSLPIKVVKRVESDSASELQSELNRIASVNHAPQLSSLIQMFRKLIGSLRSP